MESTWGGRGMKRIIVVLMAVTSSAWALEYYNFLIDEDGEGRGDNEANSYYFYSTNQWELLTLGENESIEIISTSLSTQIDSDSIQGASGGSWNWGSNTREIYVLYNDEIWDVKTLGAEETVHGPGIIYVSTGFTDIQTPTVHFYT